MLQRMVVIQIVDYLKVMLNLQLVQQLQSLKKVIQLKLDQVFILKTTLLD